MKSKKPNKWIKTGVMDQSGREKVHCLDKLVHGLSKISMPYIKYCNIN